MKYKTIPFFISLSVAINTVKQIESVELTAKLLYWQSLL